MERRRLVLDFGAMKVLVVEDELGVETAFRDFLLELGHEPVFARSAEAALGKLKTTKPDAIILDIHLPGMSGLDFLQLRPIRESGLPIVAVSGVATEAQARECLRLGAVDFVGKPALFERLRGVLDYLEPHALCRLRAEAEQRPELRRSPRVSLVIPVRVTEYNGVEWETSSMNLSQFGIKIHAASTVQAAAAAKLYFIPPDGGEPIQVISLLVRQDLDGFAFYFVKLTSNAFERLATLTAAA
jgi:CheY-like chemotaxis protein